MRDAEMPNLEYNSVLANLAVFTNWNGVTWRTEVMIQVSIWNFMVCGRVNRVRYINVALRLHESSESEEGGNQGRKHILQEE